MFFYRKLKRKLKSKFKPGSWVKKFCLGILALIFVFVMTPPIVGQNSFNYGEALQKSILFYEAQQTGKLPEWNRFPWRGDATLEDGRKEGVDLSGGWVDAGDNVKFNFPLAFSVASLAWGGIEYYDAYQKSGQLEALTQNIKWGTDYLLNSFINDQPGEYELYGQVGNGKLDHDWWGSVEVVHYEMERPAYKIDTSCPGTELAAESSAALASSSILFRQAGKFDYADLLLAKAERLYDFGDRYRGKYSDCLQEANPFYTSVSGYQDELVWGAIWLHKAKQAQNIYYGDSYLAKAEAEYAEMGKPFDYTFQFDDKSYGNYVLLAQATGNEEYQKRTEAWLDYWTVGHQGRKIHYTPGGLAFLVKWGSLPLSANTSFLAFVYSDWLQSQGSVDLAERYHNFAISQINYVLGENPANRSYLIGFGTNYPQNPHHRSAHGTWLNNMSEPVETKNVLMGALVGGPDERDQWEDTRTDWVKNEVGVSYNAAFTGALAKMYQEFGGEPLSEIAFAPIDESGISIETKSAGGMQPSNMELTIVNRSTSPARGIENPRVRVFYQTKAGTNAEQVMLKGASTDCPNFSTTTPIQLKENQYYAEAKCGGTVIYPGGKEDYQKQITLQLTSQSGSGLFDGWKNMFTKPISITKICLLDGEELLWESSF